jgi:hypothetical protein
MMSDVAEGRYSHLTAKELNAVRSCFAAIH